VGGYLQDWDLRHKGDTCCRNAVDEWVLAFQCCIQAGSLNSEPCSNLNYVEGDVKTCMWSILWTPGLHREFK